MKIISDKTSTTERRRITLEDGPIVDAFADGGSAPRYPRGTRIQVNEVSITVDSVAGWHAFVWGLKLKQDGELGKVKGELWFHRVDSAPDWLREIAAEADKTSEEKSNANNGN